MHPLRLSGSLGMGEFTDKKVRASPAGGDGSKAGCGSRSILCTVTIINMENDSSFIH